MLIQTCWINLIKSAIQCKADLIQSSKERIKNSNKEFFFPLPKYIQAKAITRLLINYPEWYLLDSESELIYKCYYYYNYHYYHYLNNQQSSPMYHNHPQPQNCSVMVDHRILSRPLAMELDPINGWMFISCHGDRSRFGRTTTVTGPAIFKASLKTSNIYNHNRDVITLVNIRLVEPSLITLDNANKRVYWIDTYLGLLLE